MLQETFKNLAADSQLLATSLHDNLVITLGVLSSLYFIAVINFLCKNILNHFGIVPRTKYGLLGIMTSPFLHADSNHLFYNSIPLFCLMNVILIQGTTLFFVATFLIIILSGLLIWACARYGIHIGASALILGYLGYLLANSYVAPSFLNIASVLVCVIYLTGLFSSLFPQKKHISFEGHIFGLIAGIITYLICPFIMNLLNLSYRHSI